MKRPVRRCRRDTENHCLIKKVVEPLEEAKEALENIDLGKFTEVAASRAVIADQIKITLWLIESSIWMDQNDERVPK